MKDASETLTVEAPGPSGSSMSAADWQAPDRPIFRRGACLGRYVLLEAIGSGGMGTIFSAFDPDLDRKVAIKILRRDLLMSEARRRAETRLQREARAVARLEHPNVVSVYDVGEAGGCFFIAMELIEGQVLSRWLSITERSWQQVVEKFDKAGRGLAAAHAAGLVHRDFKPNNVMVADDGRVLVVDFGLALDKSPTGKSENPPEKILAPSPESRPKENPTGLGTGTEPAPGSEVGPPSAPRAGTLTYMAPEQREGQRVDARADQYSFCVALYEALFGELPASGGAVETRNRDRDEPRSVVEKRARAGGAAVPNRIRLAVLKGLSLSPADRHASLDELLDRMGDSRGRLRYQAAALLFLGLVTIGWLGSRADSNAADLCTGAEERLVGVWDPVRQAGLRQLIQDSDHSYVRDSWAMVKGSLDDYTQAWQGQYTEACEATHRHGEQSPDLLDRRMACLDQRLLEAQEVTGLLLQGEAEVLARSVEIIGSLGRLAGCGDRAALLGLPAPLTGDAGKKQVAIQAKLAKARALEAAARFPQVVEVARGALADAQSLGDRSLIGEAHYWLAMGVGRLGKFTELRDHLMRSSRLALAAKDDELLARSLIRLVITGAVRGDRADAEEWAQLAQAVIERLPGREDLEARRLQSLCFVATHHRQLDDALLHCRAALDTDPEMPAQQRSIALNNLGITLVRLGRVDQALQVYDESLALVEKLYGDQHPNYAGTLRNVADIHKERGRPAVAQKLLEQALAVAEASYGPESPRILPELAGLGAVLMERGQFREAVTYLQRAVDLKPPDPAHLAIVRFDLAATLWHLGDEPTKALRLAGQALETFVSLGEPYRAEADRAQAWLEQRR